MKRYTAKEIDEAAILCGIAANDRFVDRQGTRNTTTHKVASCLGASGNAARLADAAWFRCHPSVPQSPETYAEAEALLRSGWLP